MRFLTFVLSVYKEELRFESGRVGRVTWHCGRILEGGDKSLIFYPNQTGCGGGGALRSVLRLQGKSGWRGRMV